jgi:hypothetical protein
MIWKNNIFLKKVEMKRKRKYLAIVNHQVNLLVNHQKINKNNKKINHQDAIAALQNA